MGEENIVNTELEELKKNINVLKGKLTTLESKKKELENDANDLIGKTIYEKKQAMERSYDEVLKEAEQRLKVAEKEKEEEKRKNLAKLIEHNTRSTRESNLYLTNEIKRILKDNQLPFFVDSEFYFTLWNPTTALQKIMCVLAGLVVLAIPTFICFVAKKGELEKQFSNSFLRGIIILLIYLLSIFVFGLLWLLVDKLTKNKTEALNEIKEIRKNIEDNKKEINKISKETSDNINAENFDYTKLDREIEAGKIEVENYKKKKKEALEHFVNVTQDEITKTIESEAKKGINAVVAEIDKAKSEIQELQKKHDELKLKSVE